MKPNMRTIEGEMDMKANMRTIEGEMALSGITVGLHQGSEITS